MIKSVTIKVFSAAKKAPEIIRLRAPKGESILKESIDNAVVYLLHQLSERHPMRSFRAVRLSAGQINIVDRGFVRPAGDVKPCIPIGAEGQA